MEGVIIRNVTCIISTITFLLTMRLLFQEKSLRKMFANGRARSGIIVLPCGAGEMRDANLLERGIECDLRRQNVDGSDGCLHSQEAYHCPVHVRLAFKHTNHSLTHTLTHTLTHSLTHARTHSRALGVAVEQWRSEFKRWCDIGDHLITRFTSDSPDEPAHNGVIICTCVLASCGVM